MNKEKLLECLLTEKRILENTIIDALGYRGPNQEAFLSGQEGRVSGMLSILEDIIYWIERGDFDKEVE